MSEQTPFWKKEISLSRKPKAEVPAEKREADGTDPGEVVRTPWWKKEIGGSKQPKIEAAGAEAKKTPWFKKEIGGSKQPKVETGASDFYFQDIVIGPGGRMPGLQVAHGLLVYREPAAR